MEKVRQIIYNGADGNKKVTAAQRNHAQAIHSFAL